ncbi:MAG: hypothetical protein AAF587_06860 [Bacteroidota bacterium]
MKKIYSTYSFLQRLSPKQQKDFVAFLGNTYFNRQEKLVQLANILLEDPESDMDKKSLFIRLFGEEKTYREQLVYDAISQLGKLLNKFLALQMFDTDHALQHQCLLQALSNQQEEKMYQRAWKKAVKHWEAYPYRDLSYYKGQLSIHQNATEFTAGLQERKQEEHLEASIKYLDIYYWSARLKYSCELLNRQNILNQSVPAEVLAPLNSWIEHIPAIYLETPLLHAYLLIFHSLKEPENEDRYERMIHWLHHHTDRISSKEVSDMYAYAQNCCIRRINQGASGYLKRLFDLFEQLVAKQLVLDDGVMDHRKLKNMVTVGLRLKAFDWVDTLLHMHRTHLLPRYQEDAYRFNLASLKYAQGRHSEALTQLQQVEFQDIYYHLSAKSLLLKLYFESDEDAALEFLLETFRLYLQRNQSIGAFQRKVHLNLIRFTKKLYRLREQKRILKAEVFRSRQQVLHDSILTKKEIANRSWLIEQLGQL